MVRYAGMLHQKYMRDIRSENKLKNKQICKTTMNEYVFLSAPTNTAATVEAPSISTTSVCFLVKPFQLVSPNSCGSGGCRDWA